MMMKSLPYAACFLLGGLLVGLIGSTQAAMFPPEITITQNGVNHMMREAESIVSELAAKCDKCDAQTKGNSRKAMAALRQAIATLEVETKSKVAKLIEVCQ